MPTDPRGLRRHALLLHAWLTFQEGAATPFTIPGHKHRLDLVGDVVAGDVPLYAGLDTMKLTGGVLADAELRAARLWGADFCRFSTGGATHANQAVALAIGGEGDEVVVSRTLHRALLIGLARAGLTPVWVRPDVDPATGLPLGVPAARVEAALVKHPDARAVFVGDPSYVGTIARCAEAGAGSPSARYSPGGGRRVGGSFRVPPRPPAPRSRTRRRCDGGQRALAALRQASAAGVRIAYAADPTLATIRVLV